MVVYDFVTPENLAVKYPDDGLFINGSILFKTDPDKYEVNTSFTITLSGEKITKESSTTYYNTYLIEPSGILITLQNDGLLEITGKSLRISETIQCLKEGQDPLTIIREINDYLTLMT